MIVYSSVAYFLIDCLFMSVLIFLKYYLLTGSPLLARISLNASFSRSQNARYAGTRCITNFTFALLFSYLYCTKICLFKLLLHLKSLLQISHMYFFILSWTDASWNSKAVFPPKLAIYPSMMCEWSTGHI